MTDLILPRRKFLIGAAALIAAPAIVKIGNIMPIKVDKPEFRYVKIVETITFKWNYDPNTDTVLAETYEGDVCTKSVTYFEAGIPNLPGDPQRYEMKLPKKIIYGKA